MREKLLLILTASVIALAGCSGAKEQLGLERKPPDEFAVVKRAPLSMPPDYTLRPPQPGSPRPQEQEMSEQARMAVFGEVEGYDPGDLGSGEASLLQQAGAAYVDPNIRRKVDAETYELRDRNKPVAQRLLGIGGDRDEISASVVDAPAEAERLRDNVQSGRPLTEGGTPYKDE